MKPQHLSYLPYRRLFVVGGLNHVGECRCGRQIPQIPQIPQLLRKFRSAWRHDCFGVKLFRQQPPYRRGGHEQREAQNDSAQNGSQVMKTNFPPLMTDAMETSHAHGRELVKLKTNNRFFGEPPMAHRNR
jgi:hypothetical protein